MNLPGLRILMPAILLLLAGPAYAEEDSSTDSMRFSEHDVDGDGYISRQEYKAFIQHLRMQRGGRAGGPPGSGGQRHRYRWGTMHFVEIDTNKDGLISEEEMLAALQKRFQRPPAAQ